MKITYDVETDTLRILFRHVPIKESDEERPGIVFDFDKKGNVVGLEVLNASKRVENPKSLEYAIDE